MFWSKRDTIGHLIAANLRNHPEEWEADSSNFVIMGSRTALKHKRRGWRVVEAASFMDGYSVGLDSIPTTSSEDRALSKACRAWYRRALRMKRDAALQEYHCGDCKKRRAK